MSLWFVYLDKRQIRNDGPNGVIKYARSPHLNLPLDWTLEDVILDVIELTSYDDPFVRQNILGE